MMGEGKLRCKGRNYDGLVSTTPNTRTFQCLNQFCGYTFAEDMDEVSLRACKVTVSCPMCGGTDLKIISYTPNPPNGRKPIPRRKTRRNSKEHGRKAA